MIRHAKKRAKLPVSDKIYYAFAYTYTILLTAIVLYPLILTLSSSFSSGVAVSTGKVILWPVNPTTAGFYCQTLHLFVYAVYLAQNYLPI